MLIDRQNKYKSFAEIIVRNKLKAILTAFYSAHGAE